MTQSGAFAQNEQPVKIVRLSDRQKELDKLPPPETRRWVMRRKAQVVAAVRSGLLTFEEACQRYRLSEEEFKCWIALLDRHGLRGLRATRVQEYRPAEERARAESAAE
ncbi:MAG TPA: DUF1153 domain-containing protein [Alphaproteobacteria bacterium]|nr:DUF1153 domain-containing protein [Alphaproteobacteria bacterium]